MVTDLIKQDIVIIEATENETKYKVKEVAFDKKTGYEILKRAFDIVASFCAILICFIPMIFIAIAIVLDSEGGAVYSQERLGKNGKPFMLYKFRTMRIDAEKNGAQWATANDDRCTKVGTFLRKTRLDELMQLINIFKGDMSIVGPRPERKIFYDEFATYIDGFDRRLLIKPGLTGLAQISGGYDLKPEEKIIPDVQYIETRNIWLDIKIIFKTVAIVFNHNGAR